MWVGPRPKDPQGGEVARSRLSERELWGRSEVPAREDFVHSKEELSVSKEILTYVPNQRKSQCFDIHHPEGTDVLFFFISPSCLAASRSPWQPPVMGRHHRASSEESWAEGADILNLVSYLDGF